MENEDLKIRWTAEGQKEGLTQARFFVAITNGRGVTLAEQYCGRTNSNIYWKFVDKNFEQAFNLSGNNDNRLFLQDGDPSQNSARAWKIYDNLSATVFKIPPRSPDLNPIDNFFYLVDQALHADTKRKR